MMLIFVETNNNKKWMHVCYECKYSFKVNKKPQILVCVKISVTNFGLLIFCLYIKKRKENSVQQEKTDQRLQVPYQRWHTHMCIRWKCGTNKL